MPTPSHRAHSHLLESLPSAPCSQALWSHLSSSLDPVQQPPHQFSCSYPILLPSVLHTGLKKLPECNMTTAYIHTHTPLPYQSLIAFPHLLSKAKFLWPWTVPSAQLSSLSAWRSHPSFPLGHPALDGAFADCPASSRTTLCFAPPHWGAVPCFGDAPLCMLSLSLHCELGKDRTILRTSASLSLSKGAVTS